MTTYFENAQSTFSLNWAQSDRSQGSSILLDSGQVKSATVYTSGTGIGKANIAWHISTGMDVSTSHTYDLFNLTRRILGGNSNAINFSGGYIKSFIAKNISGESMTIYFGGIVQPFNAPFSSTDTFVLLPSGESYMFSYGLGWPVMSGQRKFAIQNDAASLKYELAIIGVKL